MILSNNYKEKIFSTTIRIWVLCKVFVFPRSRPAFDEFLTELVDALESETKLLGPLGTLFHATIRSAQIAIYLFAYYRERISKPSEK